VYKTLKAKDLYRKIMEHAWKTGEPGVSFRDLMDRSNPNPHMGKIDASNPCSEFTSVPFNSCNLGSINLYNHVSNKELNSNKLNQTVKNAVRYLDNMITVNKLPLKEIEEVTKKIRSVGLGVMGYADMLYALRIPYNSKKGLEFTDQLLNYLWLQCVETGEELAEEKGVYDNWENSVWCNQNIKSRCSNYLSIAPTGSISFIANVSGGLEPNFALVYQRETYEGDKYFVVNAEFEKALKEYGIYSEELIQKVFKEGSIQNIKEIPEDIRKVFVVAGDLTPQEHINTLEIFYKYIDLSASKTINLPSTATVEDIEDVYMDCWKRNIKCVTIYRDGSRENQVLTTGKDTKKETQCNYKLERGVILDVAEDLIGKKRKLMSGCGSLHVLAYFEPTTGELLETFLSKGSTGGCQNFMVGLSRMISHACRLGGNVYAIADQLKSSGTCPSYSVRRATKKDTSLGSSCPIAIANALIEMYEEVQSELFYDEEKENKKTIIEEVKNNCPECGKEMTLIEGCKSCIYCGFSLCN